MDRHSVVRKDLQSCKRTLGRGSVVSGEGGGSEKSQRNVRLGILFLVRKMAKEEARESEEVRAIRMGGREKGIICGRIESYRGV